MSTYFTIFGRLQYKTQSQFDKVVSLLKSTGYISGDDYYIGEKISINRHTLEIEIPDSGYRNLGNILDEITENTIGQLVWTCTDGMFIGGVITDGVEKGYDLKEYGSKYVSLPPDIDENPDLWMNWASEVEYHFLENNV